MKYLIAAGMLFLGMILVSCSPSGADRRALQNRVDGGVTVTLQAGEAGGTFSSWNAGKRVSSIYSAMRRFLEDEDSRTARRDCQTDLSDAAAALGCFKDASGIPPELAERVLISRACDEAILSQENPAENRILIKAGETLRTEPGRSGKPFRIELRSPEDSGPVGSVLVEQGGCSSVSARMPGVGAPGEPGILGVVASAPSAFLAVIIAHAVYLSPASRWRRILEATRPEGLAIVTGDSTILLSAQWYESFTLTDENWTVLRF